MANENYDGKYLRCDIVAVKDAGVGGRLFSAITDVEIPNGVIGTLGETLEGLPEIKDTKKSSEWDILNLNKK